MNCFESALPFKIQDFYIVSLPPKHLQVLHGLHKNYNVNVLFMRINFPDTSSNNFLFGVSSELVKDYKGLELFCI